LNEEAVDITNWTEKDEDDHVRNLYKADLLLDDVLYRMNLYHLASEHYGFLNNACFVTPSIIITSIAGFLSFLAASAPEHAKTISMTVGLLSTLATIITAMQSASKYDSKAESFRGAASEYRLLQTRINGCFRKAGLTEKGWAVLWAEVETRMTDMQKKMSYSPARNMVEAWHCEGKLSERSETSASIPPWLVRYLQNLEDDGIQTADDIKFIPDELFDLWVQPLFSPHPTDKHKNVFDPGGDFTTSTQGESTVRTTRYPKVVIEKLKEIRNRQRKEAARKAPSMGGTSLALHLKPTTLAALRVRGMTTSSDLRHADDDILDNVVSELVKAGTAPMPVAWGLLEEMVQDVKRFGQPMSNAGWVAAAFKSLACLCFYGRGLDAAAERRYACVVGAMNEAHKPQNSDNPHF